MQKRTLIVVGILALCLVIVLGSTALMAQAKGKTLPARKACVRDGAAGPRIAQALNLTDAQKAQVKSIMEDAKTRAKSVMEDQSLAQDAKKAKLREIHQSAKEKIGKILTPEQQKKLEQLKAKVRERLGSPEARQRLMKERAAQGMKGIARALKLTEQQKTQIKPILKAEAEKIKAIVRDQNVPREQKRAEILKLKEQTRAQIDPILTAEQRQKLDAIMAKVREKWQQHKLGKG